MYKNSTWTRSEICSCILYQNAIYRKIFKPFKVNIYHYIYKNLPEDTVFEKIIKIRKLNNLDRNEFAKKIGHHWSTVQHWEIDNVPPKPESIKDICDTFGYTLQYFGEYYYIYFNSPGELIRKWKSEHKYSYNECARILGLSYSGFAKIMNGRINLSFEMYKILKRNNIIKS